MDWAVDRLTEVLDEIAASTAFRPSGRQYWASLAI